MSRCFVLGYAPLPFEPRRLQRSGNLRTWQLVEPLLEAGHEVLLVAARIPGSYDEDAPPEITTHPDETGKGRLRYVSVDFERFHAPGYLQRQHDAFAPDVVIGINSHPAARLARLETDRPMWCDLNGWAMAEGQTKAATHGDDLYLSHFWNLERAALDRGDVFSTVTRAQAHATIGELAARGRLSQRTLGWDFCHPIPNAVAAAPERPEGPKIRGSAVPDDAFVLLWLGGYNTWADGDLLAAGLDRAMAEADDLFFVSTGGPLAGHDELTFERFRRRVDTAPWRQRVHFAGWVPTEEVPGYCFEADLGLNIDAPCYETVFGARTRLNGMLETRLPILTTLGTEISHDLVDRGLALGTEPRDAEGLAEKILWARDNREALRTMGREAAAFGREQWSYRETARPLLEWVRSPRRAPDGGEPAKLDPTIDFFGPPRPPQPSKVPREHLERRCRQLEERLEEITESKMWRLWMLSIRLRRWLSGGGAAPRVEGETAE